MNKICNIFDQTLRHFRIKAVELSERAGVSNSSISAIRKGRPTTTDTLEKILDAMEELAPGSKGYFYHQLAGSDHLIDLINELPNEQLAVLIDLVADRLRSGGNIKRPQETLIGA
jgi:DNA-binding Xre family transcriptional regulator